MDNKEFKVEMEKNGYVILRNFIPLSTLTQVQKGVEDLVEELAQERLVEGYIPETYSKEPFNNRFRKIYENDQSAGPLQFTEKLQKKEFFDLYSYPPLLKLVQSYLGDEVLLLMNVVRIRAFPNEKYRSLWHQDTAYLGAGKDSESDKKFEALRFINCWAPLVPVNKNNGCMEFIPGSHKNGIVKHIPMEPNHYLQIDPEILNPYLDTGKAVDIELEVGDIVLFHNMIFHQGQENLSGKLRWNADFRFRDATQNTLGKDKGHYIISSKYPEKLVASGEDWELRPWQ
jgi:phytanoyl-CoA hydroxylase